MEAALEHFVSGLSGWLLAGLIMVSFALLGRAADWLVDEAVSLSEHSGIPKVVIGSTIVSLGTTTPETAVSVAAALQGRPGLALGNAVGSVICDTGLILGVACLLAPLKLDRKMVNRQGWIQIGVALALVAACFPWSAPQSVFTAGGRLPQFVGFAFLIGLAVYLWQSIRWARQAKDAVQLPEHREEKSVPLILVKLISAVALVVLAARVLIPAVMEAAARLHVPESIIAATMVAFGTSLPELVTAVTAARRGHGELAVGNVIGADILNVLFVAGSAAALTPAGLKAGSHFFLVLFPIMVLVLLVFRAGIFLSGSHMKRPFGYVLLASYGFYLIVSYLLPGDAGSM